MQRRDVTPELLAELTERLLGTARTLGDADLAAPSLCEGWTRGHVLSHLARNADALRRVARVATEGTADTMYDSVESRDADIESGAGRSSTEQAADLEASAARLADELRHLEPGHRSVQVERTPGGPLIPVGAVPFLRAREVVYHHVDLDTAYGFADAPSELVDLFLRDAVERLGAGDPDAAPDVTLVTDEGDEYVLGRGATRVAGTRADVLLWLARSRTEGLRVEGDLPTLPFGG